jgi:hypothetical protein
MYSWSLFNARGSHPSVPEGIAVAAVGAGPHRSFRRTERPIKNVPLGKEQIAVDLEMDLIHVMKASSSSGFDFNFEIFVERLGNFLWFTSSQQFYLYNVELGKNDWKMQKVIYVFHRWVVLDTKSTKVVSLNKVEKTIEHFMLGILW